MAHLIRRAAEAAAELLGDADLRSKARAALEREAGARVAALGRAGRRLAGAPRGARETLRRLQASLATARLQAMLQAERDAPVDVQVGTVLYEDAPQELRSRLWMALLEAGGSPGALIGRVAPGEEEEAGGGEGGADPAAPAPHPASVPPPAADDAWEMVEDGSAALWSAGGGGGGRAGGPPHPPAGPSSSSSPGGARGWGTARPPPSVIVAATAMGRSGSEPGEARGGAEAAPPPPYPPPILTTLTAAPRPTRLRDALIARATSLHPWPPPPTHPEACLYNTLQQVSVGQEGVEEVIGRDIGRTFPEHPQFGFAQGRAALFRLLKAQALADLEVGYCQGMAFLAGVLLMYLPEEAAFRAMGALLADAVGPDGAQQAAGAAGDDDDARPPPLRPGWAPGAGLRSLYLPGLEGLKATLRQYEWLLARVAPAAAARLEELGVPPALYAAQWVLTAFACPFPAPFAARVLDALLTERRAAPLIRVALAVAAECEPDLAAARDFESAVAVLKVQPLSWPPARARAVLDRGLGGRLVPAAALAAAEAACSGEGEGGAPAFEGSLARRPSGQAEAAAARAAAATRRGEVDAAIAAFRRRGESPTTEGGQGGASGSASEEEEDVGDDLAAVLHAVFDTGE